MDAVKATDAAQIALRGDGKHYVSLDEVIETMPETGADMKIRYKEAALGGSPSTSSKVDDGPRPVGEHRNDAQPADVRAIAAANSLLMQRGVIHRGRLGPLHPGKGLI